MRVGTLKGCETSGILFGQEVAPLQGAKRSLAYRRSPLRSDLRLLPDNPAGCKWESSGKHLFSNRLESPFTNRTCITLEAPRAVKTPAFDCPV